MQRPCCSCCRIFRSRMRLQAWRVCYLYSHMQYHFCWQFWWVWVSEIMGNMSVINFVDLSLRITAWNTCNWKSPKETNQSNPHSDLSGRQRAILWGVRFEVWEEILYHWYGCFLKLWYPQNTPKWSFLVGKPMVVGYHHFRKPLYLSCFFLHFSNPPKASPDISIHISVRVFCGYCSSNPRYSQHIYIYIIVWNRL